MLKTSLRYLMSVARHGSIRAASSELNIAQSAVSRRLQALEYQIGTALFERRPRGVVLTEAGEMLYSFCRSVNFDVERLRSELDELQGLRRGKVRIASIESLVPSILSRAVDRFRRQYSGITFTIDVLTTDDIMKAVLEGDVDIGMMFGRALTSDFHIVHKIREPLLAVMSPDHPLAGRSGISLQDIAQWPVALAHPNSGSRAIFDAACLGAGIKVKPALESNSVELMHRFALLGSGITLLLRHSTIDSVTMGHLTTVQIEGQALAGDLNIATLTDRKLPLAAERFLVTVGEELDSLPMSAAPTDAAKASDLSK